MLRSIGWRRSTPQRRALIASDAILPGSTPLVEAHADHWDVALPRNRDPNAFMRSMASGRDYPRATLFRAMLIRVVDGCP